LLCGREEVIAEALANCQSDRHTVVSSEPGLGVTSLFEAGIAPALKRAGYIVVVHRYWQGGAFVAEFTDAIANAVREQADAQYLAQGEPLDEMLHYIRQRTGRRVAVLLDQFEDYVRCQTNTHQSDLFDADLGRVIAQREGCCVIGLHAHSIPPFERLQQHVPNLLGYHIRLQPLTPEVAEEAVRREAASRLIEEIEPAVMEALLTAPAIARQDGRVHPFFLKIATSRLLDAEYRTKSYKLRMSTVDAFDGVNRIVLESLDPIIQEFSVTHQDLLFRWFNILITVDNTRLSVTEKGLTEYAGRLNRFVLTLLPALVEKGVLRTLQTKDVLRYEVAHEGYAPILRDWWERREAKIIARRRAQFRVTSISVAVGAILVIYVVWIIFGTAK
jgi:hypothetical protein